MNLLESKEGGRVGYLWTAKVCGESILGLRREHCFSLCRSSSFRRNGDHSVDPWHDLHSGMVIGIGIGAGRRGELMVITLGGNTNNVIAAIGIIRCVVWFCVCCSVQVGLAPLYVPDMVEFGSMPLKLGAINFMQGRILL